MSNGEEAHDEVQDEAPAAAPAASPPIDMQMLNEAVKYLSEGERRHQVLQHATRVVQHILSAEVSTRQQMEELAKYTQLAQTAHKEWQDTLRKKQDAEVAAQTYREELINPLMAQETQLKGALQILSDDIMRKKDEIEHIETVIEQRQLRVRALIEEYDNTKAQFEAKLKQLQEEAVERMTHSLVEQPTGAGGEG